MLASRTAITIELLEAIGQAVKMQDPIIRTRLVDWFSIASVAVVSDISDDDRVSFTDFFLMDTQAEFGHKKSPD